MNNNIKNGQSAAKPLNNNELHEEGSTTISQESTGEISGKRSLFNGKIKIYTLMDPTTKEIRYVGKTKYSLNDRLCKHLITYEKNHRANWIRKLVKNNLKPEIELIEEVDEDIWKISEIYWIAQFKAWGFKLLNATEGGESGIISPQCREACIKKNTGSKRKNSYIITPETRKRISDSLKGRKLSVETLRKRSLTITGRKLTQEHKNKIGERHKTPILQYDLEGNFIKEYSSMTEAAKLTNCSISKISMVCANKNSKHKNFIWKYK